MPLRRPALDPPTIEPRSDSGYPEPFRSRVLPREKRQLGTALGLTQFGVNLTTLPPGKESSMRHWHTHEEEFVYVLEGEVVLRTDAGEQLLSAGHVRRIPGRLRRRPPARQPLRPPGRLPRGRHSNDAADAVLYPDVDLRYDPRVHGGKFIRKDGTPY